MPFDACRIPLHLGGRMIPITPRTCQHFVDWCKQYQDHGTFPHPGNTRFSIGFYQISQGMSWHIASPVKWQSFCSAAMHMTMCMHALGIDPEPGFPETLADIDAEWRGWEHLMLVLGKAQQQIFYAYNCSGSNRARRYSPSVAHVYLHTAVEQCFSLAPPEYREQGCFDEMKILFGDLPEKKS